MKTITREPGTQLILQQIRQNGPMPFREFVDLALYHPQYGYYNRKAPQRGRQGDYFTALQVSSLFPSIFAEALLQMRATLGTEQFTLVELGSGGGEFLEGVLKELESRNQLKGFQVWACERSRSARDLLSRRLSRFPKCRVLSSLEDIERIGGVEGCIFSNEFFDAISFHRLKFTGSTWQEIFVEEKNGQLVEAVGALSNPALLDTVDLSGLDFLEGQKIEIRPNISETWNAWGQLLTRGFVVTVDYGYPRHQLMSPRRLNGTVMCYHQHEANKNPFGFIGRQDITAHIDFTQLAEEGRRNGLEPVLFCSQGQFLTHMGQEKIQTFLSSAPPLEQPKRMAALQQLIHPDAMGEAFWMLIHQKETQLPAAFHPIPNRLRRLIPPR